MSAITAIKDFRLESDKVTKLRKLLENPVMEEAMQILSLNGPATRQIKSDITPTFASIKLGHNAGWAECLTTLAWMATHPSVDDVDNPRLRDVEEED